jgi:hypothetical protein
MYLWGVWAGQREGEAARKRESHNGGYIARKIDVDE